MKLQTINRYINRYEKVVSEYKKLNQEPPPEVYSSLNHWNRMLELHSTGDGLGAPYIPESSAPRLNVDVPDSMDSETHEIIDRIDHEVGGMDEYVRRKLHFSSVHEMYTDIETGKGLSAEQIDAVGMAIYNIETKNQFMIVSDQTGIGKGRIAAAILRYAHYVGKKPIFLTIRANLFSDMYRDLADVYMDDMNPVKVIERDENGQPVEYQRRKVDKETGEVTYEPYFKYQTVKKPKKGRKFIPFILNNKQTGNDPTIKNRHGDMVYEVKGGEARKKEYNNVVRKLKYKQYDCFMATYSQFINDVDKLEFLEHIMKDNIVVLDESHEAGGEGKRAENIRQIINSAIGGLFLSATYAKYPKNMPLYAQTTAIKYAGLKPDEFVKAMISGGNALQEVVSSQLVESGCLIRRERPLSNIKFNYISLDQYGAETYNVPDKEVEHNAIFDNITSVLRGIIEFQKNYINDFIEEQNAATEEKKYTNEQAKSVREALTYKNAPMFNRLFQIVNQTVFSLKAREIAHRAIQRLKDGKKTVITFENTMESWLKRIQDMHGKNNVYTDFSEVLMRGLETVMHYQEVKEIVTTTTETDENGSEKEVKSTEKQVIDMEVDPELLPESGKTEYYSLLDKISEITVGISISPLDVITSLIEKAGFSVGEITGRGLKVEFEDDSYNKGRIISRKKESSTDIARKFNYNELDCLLINKSGSTGISLHSKPEPGIIEMKSPEPPTSLFPKDEVKQRVMIVSQPNLDINSMVQTWGRVNRSGQAYRPEYDFVTLGVPAEQRLMLFLQRKLKSLDANTTANQKQNAAVINMEDFMNKYGDEIVYNWVKEHPELDQIMDEPLWKTPRYPLKDPPPEARDYRSDEKGRIRQYETSENAAQTVSGRVALLPTKDQREFYDSVNEKYKAKIRQLKENNQYDLEVEFKPLNAVLLNKKIKMEGDVADNPFASPVVIEEVEVDVLDKPFKPEELENYILNRLGEKWPDQIQDEMIYDFKDHIEKHLAATLNRTKARYEKLMQEVPGKPSMQRILKKEGKQAFQQAVTEKQMQIQQEWEEKREKHTQNAKEKQEYLLPILKAFRIGKGYMLDTGEVTSDSHGNRKNIILKSVFLGFKIDKEQTNPYAPSNIEAEFAPITGHPKRTYQPTEAGGIKQLKDTISATRLYPYQDDLNKLRENWKAETQTEDSDREKRHVITGNILAAYRDFDSSLISYNYRDGSTKKGMFMPKNYAPDMTTEVSMKHIKPLLDDLSIGTIITNDSREGNKRRIDGITFERFYDWEENKEKLKVKVPKSAKHGAKYYKKDSLIRLLDDPVSGFRDMGDPSYFSAFLPEENIQTFLDVLHYEFEPRQTVKLSGAQYDVIKDTLPSAKEKKEKKKDKTSKIIKLEAKYIKMYPEMKKVAGFSGLSRQDQKAVKALEKYMEKRGLNPKNIPALSGVDAKKIAKKYNINLDKLNI